MDPRPAGDPNPLNWWILGKSHRCFATPCQNSAGRYTSRFVSLREVLGDFSMAVKLRLKRMGRTNAAFYRLNAIDSRSPRDGRVIEELGYYNPREKEQAKQFVAKLDRCKDWLDKGAVPSETVSTLLKRS